MLKKKVMTICLLVVFLFSAFNTPALAKGITVIVKNQELSFAGDQEPITQDGRVLVPMRKIFEALDIPVEWNQKENMVSAGNEKIGLAMIVGYSFAVVVDGKNPAGKEVKLDVAPQLLNDRVLVPIRFVGESTGATVDWNADKKEINIY